MAGIGGVSSICFVGKVLGKEVSFLADTGATHNFVDLVTVKRLWLKTRQMGNFEVEVANGEKAKGSTCCKGVTLHIQGVESSAIC